MNATRKVKLKDISSNLACKLCKGYMIDASTTIECLHSFCKSCIVLHLEKSEYCPACGVQLHSTKPLSGIRPDKMLQEIIFKLVPGLFQSEMERRRAFYKSNSKSIPISQMDSGQIYNQPYITSDDKINISLEYSTNDKIIRESTKRYFNCPAEVSVSILKKLVQGKHDLANDDHIDIMYGGERILPDDFLLMDIAYKYSWTDSVTKPLQLSYRLKDVPHYLLKIPQLGKRPAARKSRSLTDSEVLKSSNVNSQVVVTPKITPNGKVRGRKKRSLISDEKSPIVESKKKKSSKQVESPNKNFKEMESQSDNSHLLNNPFSVNQNEVQLQISETGVISAKVFDDKNLIEEGKQVQRVKQEPNMQIIPSPHVVESIINSQSPKLNQYITLNIPTVNGLSFQPTTNGTPMKVKDGVKKKCMKRKIGPSFSKIGNGIETEESFESKKANVQKALKDLQKQKIASLEHQKKLGHPLVKNGEKESTSKYSLKTMNGLGLNSQIPLPFPLSALESSGMSVNLIPSSDLKTKKGNASPPKQLKHQTTVVNGDMKFTTSPRHILPSPAKGSQVNGEASPKKLPKFFKSRHSSATMSPDKEIKVEKHKSQTQTPHYKVNGMIGSSGLQCPSTGDLKLINSTSSKKSSTTTTPSRMTTPSNTGVQCTPSLTQLQLLQLYNPMLRFPSIESFAQQAYKPLVTNDYISMPFFNSRAINNSTLPSTSNFSYPMLYPSSNSNNFAFANLAQFAPNMSAFTNGISCTTTQSLAPAVTATDLSISKIKPESKESSTSLDLTVKKPNNTPEKLVKDASSPKPPKKIKTSIKSQIIPLVLNGTNSFNSSDSKNETSKEALRNGDDKNTLVDLIQNGHSNDKELDPSQELFKKNDILEEAQDIPKKTDESIISQLTLTIPQAQTNEKVPEKVLEDAKQVIKNGQLSPSNSDESVDLVINEDVTLPEPSLQENEDNSSTELDKNTFVTPEPAKECIVQEAHTTDGNKEEKIANKELEEDGNIKKFPICNNNNDPPADSSIPQQKLEEVAESVSTTGA